MVRQKTKRESFTDTGLCHNEGAAKYTEKTLHSSFQKAFTAGYTYSETSQNIGYAKPRNCIALSGGSKEKQKDG